MAQSVSICSQFRCAPSRLNASTAATRACIDNRCRYAGGESIGAPSDACVRGIPHTDSLYRPAPPAWKDRAPRSRLLAVRRPRRVRRFDSCRAYRVDRCRLLSVALKSLKFPLFRTGAIANYEPGCTIPARTPVVEIITIAAFRTQLQRSSRSDRVVAIDRAAAEPGLCTCRGCASREDALCTELFDCAL